MRNNCYVLTGRSGTKEARYAVVPCADGWYEHYLNGDREMRHYHRYVSEEGLHDLIQWWQLDYDSYNYVSAPDIDQLRDDLKYVWTWSEAFVDSWGSGSTTPSTPPVHAA